MKPNIFMSLIIVIITIKIGNGAIPGTFFWKPRLGLDLAIPTTESTMAVYLPSKENLREGLVVMIDGYKVGMTFVGLASGTTSAKSHPHMNPMSAYFYTTSYRWALRHLSMLPSWLGGSGGSYCDTHRVWKRRFFYMDEFLPKWMRYIFPYVEKAEWEKEEKEMRRFKKYAESAFGKFYRYPSKTFNNFTSQEPTDTLEHFDSSSSQSTGYG